MCNSVLNVAKSCAAQYMYIFFFDLFFYFFGHVMIFLSLGRLTIRMGLEKRLRTPPLDDRDKTSIPFGNTDTPILVCVAVCLFSVLCM